MKSVRFVTSICLAMAATLAQPTFSVELDQRCVVNVLNRTVAVSSDGGWSLPNVPTNQGQIRARAICSNENGSLSVGQSAYFSVPVNSVVDSGAIRFDWADAEVPTALGFFEGSNSETLNSIGGQVQLLLMARYANGDMRDVTNSESGINYTSSNPAIVSVSANGLITAQKNGRVILTARKDGVIATKSVLVTTSGDFDQDGLPDDYETENGLNPNDPADAFEDQDKDGVSALDEFGVGTHPLLADTDEDGISDGEELVAGEDGFITNPLLKDTDGDAINDGLEVALGFDPTDSSSGDLSQALDHLSLSLETLVLSFNTMEGEASSDITVTGHFIDGSEADLTDRQYGTEYASSDLSIASFGLIDGRIFAGQAGNAIITVSNNGYSAELPVFIERFEPTSISSTVVNSAKDVAVQGNLVFVAAGGDGLTVVDVSNKSQPELLTTLDLGGDAVNIQIRGQYAYIAGVDSGFWVVDISVPEIPVVVNQYDTQGLALNLVLQNDYLFLADSQMGVRILYIEDVQNIFEVSGLESRSARRVAVQDNWLAVASDFHIDLYNIQDIDSPQLLSTTNISNVESLGFRGNQLYAAVGAHGWRIYEVTESQSLRVVHQANDFRPNDLAIAGDYAFWADFLFARSSSSVVAYTNHKDSQSPYFQDTIALNTWGLTGRAIALDASHIYTIQSDSIDRRTLNIAQYRPVVDELGVPPTVQLLTPENDLYKVSGEAIQISAEANDDVAISFVSFFYEGQKVGDDNTYPYSMSYVVPPHDDSFYGSALIRARATDVGGNESWSESHVIFVENDEDGDRLLSADEVEKWGTDPLNPDTDGDLLSDHEEVIRGYNPLSEDTDGDGINDYDEVQQGTDPTNPDVTKPTIVSIDPDDGSVDVPENSSITLSFDEPLKLTSVNVNTVRIMDGSVAVKGVVQLLPTKNQILFTPNVFLRDLSEHAIQVSGVTDLAGNAVADAEFSFVTGDTIDTSNPRVDVFAPKSNSQGVPVNSVFTAVFNEPVDPSTINTDNFYVLDSLVGEKIEGTISIVDNRILTFIPLQPLKVGSNYIAITSSYIKDFAGNSAYSNSSYITTAFDPDLTAPEIESTTVGDGMVHVPLNVRLNVKFSETINPASIGNIKLLKMDEVVAASRQLSSDSRMVTIQPSMPLEPLTEYVLVVDLISDLSENLLPTEHRYTFQTGDSNDTSGERGVSWSIAPYLTNLSTNTVLKLRLDEPVDPTTVVTETAIPYENSATFKLIDATANNRSIEGRYILGDDRQTLTFVPVEGLRPNRRYHFQAGGYPYFQDLAGNGMSISGYLSFTTGKEEDSLAPELSLNIGDNAEAIATNTFFIVRTSERVSALTCDTPASAELVSASGDVIQADVVVAEDGLSFSVAPQTVMAPETQYTLQISNVCDYSGNSVAQSYNFTTGLGADELAPELLSYSPVTETTQASADTSFTLTFDEPIASNAKIVVSPPFGGFNNGVLGRTEVSGNVVTFIPDEPLLSGRYVVDFTYKTDIRDLAGNPYLGDYLLFSISAPQDVEPPQVIAMSPTQNSVDVSPNTLVTVTFSESVSPYDLEAVFFADGEVYSTSVSASLDYKTMTFSGMPASSLVSLVINRALDLSGNVMPPFIASFTTSIQDVDGVRPSIMTSFPLSGSELPLSSHDIYLVADEALDVSTIAGSLHVTENAIEIEPVIEVLHGGRTIKISSSEPYMAGSRVGVYLDSGVRDLSGNALTNYSAFYGVASNDPMVGVAPQPLAYFPESGAEDVPVNTKVHALLSEALDDTSLLEGVELVDASGAIIPAQVALDANNAQLIEVTPEFELSPFTTYSLNLLTTLKDSDGDLLAFTYDMSFTTGDWADDKSPASLGMTPLEGATNIGINSDYSVWFDEAVNPLLLKEATSGLADIRFSLGNRVLQYRHLGFLNGEAQIEESGPAVEDSAGNVSLPYGTSFETQSGFDFEKPFIKSSSIPDNSYSSPAYMLKNDAFELMFNEPIAPVSVNESNVYLYDTNSRENFPGVLLLSDDNQKVEFVPTAEFPLTATIYRLYVRNLRDLSGNTMHSRTFYIRMSGNASDAGDPGFVNASLLDGQTDVPRNVRMAVQYNETLNPLETDGVVLLNAEGELVPIEVTSEYSSRILRVVPKVLLGAEALYTLIVGGVQDTAGFIAENQQISFTTSNVFDFTRGRSEWQSIPADAVVPRNAIAQMRFDEPLDITTVRVGFDGASINIVNTANKARTSGLFELSEDRRTLTVSMWNGFNGNTSYNILIGDEGSYYQFDVADILDLSGNRVSTFFNYLRFTTTSEIDVTPPTFVEASIDSGGVEDVPLNARVTLSFSESMGQICDFESAITVRDIDDGSILDVTASSNYSDYSQIVVRPGNMSPGRTYAVEMDGLCDYAANPLAPAEAIRFTTTSVVE